MPASGKAKAAGVSASSFLDLKAELSKQEAEFSKRRAAGKTYVVGGIQRPDKKATIWARTNKGISGRIARDLEAETISKPTADSVKAALEKKARIYDKLKQGKSGGLTDAQYDALLVDFDSKPVDDQFSSDSEDEDESLTVPKAPDDESDPYIEYEDEFGRVRTARKSEVPRHLMPRTEEEKETDDDPFVIYNPVNHFPVYEPSAERVAAIQEAASEAANPLATHYDVNREVRAKGAAFYAFSADEETRNREMEELKKAREETERSRRETGAVDIKPGEMEGMISQSKEEHGDQIDGTGKGKEAVLAARSRAAEKRKREIEERRKLIEAKRKKVQPQREDLPADDERPSKPKEPVSKPVGLTDPFSALEASLGAENRQSGSKKSRWDKTVRQSSAGTASRVSVADEFLAQLERDLVKDK